MTKQSKKEYLNEMRLCYTTATKVERSRILDESMKICRFHRKYLIKVLNRKPKPMYPKVLHGGAGKKAGRPPKYDAPEILSFLVRIWHATSQACGKRLKSIIPLWLLSYKPTTRMVLPLTVQVALVEMSPATIDRLLAEERKRHRIGKGRATTKPGTLLKHHIPIKTDQWKEKRLGYLGVDTVAHCGMSMAGMFVYSLDTTDLSSGWTEARATWGKGETGVVKAFQSIEEALMFPVRGFHSDNGSEFINHHLHKYLRRRKRQVQQTRSREYKKNDNAHIEQKNWTYVRQIFGYRRFDNPQVVDMMNDLYANEYSLLMNFFLPSVKLQDKERIGSKIIKRYDVPQTPAQRLLTSRAIPEETKQRIREILRTVSPWPLRVDINHKVNNILHLCSLRPQSAYESSSENTTPDNHMRVSNGHPSDHRASVALKRGLTLKLTSGKNI